MPIYEITAPDGKTYEIEGPPGASRQDVISAIIARNPLAAQPPAPPKEGIMAALTGGVKRFGSTLETGLESIIDPTLAAQRGTARQEAISQQYAPGASLEKVKRAYEEKGLFPAAYEAVSQVPSALAEQFPNIASSIGGARVGAMAGSPFGPAGAIAGGIGGAFVPSLMQLYGSNLERQAQEKTPEISRSAALGAAVPGAAAEVASTFIPLGRNLIGKLLGPEAEKALTRGTTQGIEAAAKETLATSLAKGAGIGALAEIPTEVTQQMLERYQAGLPLTTSDALAEYGESAYGAAIVGAPFGAVARGAGRPAAREEYTKQLQLEQIKAEQQRQRDAEAAFKRTQEERAKTEEELGVPKMLALPAPAKAAEDEKDPLQNPIGRVTEDELGKAIGNNTVVNYINKYRKENNLPKLKSYSIEDIKDAMTAQNPEGEEGALNAILAYKTNYQNETYTPQDIQNRAVAKNVATETKGWNDFLTRTTGKSDVNTMTQPELHSVATALDALKRTGKEEQLVLPEGSNATRFTQDQYNEGVTQALMNVKEGKPVTLDQAREAIKAQTDLKTDRDADHLLKTAASNEDLIVEKGTGFQAVSPGGVVLGTYGSEAEAKRKHRRADILPIETQLVRAPEEVNAEKVAQLPEGYEIKQKKVAGDSTPAAYVVREEDSQKNASQTFADEADAKERLNILTRKREANAAAEEAAADRIRQDLEKKQAKIAQMEADGQADTAEHKNAVNAYQAANVTGSAKITEHLDKAEAFRKPLRVVPLGKKTARVEKHTVIKQGKEVASFPDRAKAEQHILTNASDAELKAIADRGGSLGKRAEIEMQDRQRTEPGIKVKGTAAGLEAAGVRTPEVEAQLKELEAKLIPMLKKFGLEQVGLNVVRAIENDADGAWGRADKLIRIALQATEPIKTMRHEALHALKELGFFTDAQWEALKRQADKVWVDKYLKGVPFNETISRYDAYANGLYDADGNTLMAPLSRDEILEEAIADAFGDWEGGAKPPPGMMAALFKRLQQFFSALRQALTGAGFESAEDIFGKIERGELKPQFAEPSKVDSKMSLKQANYNKDANRLEVSTARPTAVRPLPGEIAPRDPIKDFYVIDSEDIMSVPAHMAAAHNAISAYNWFPISEDPNATVRAMKDTIVDNLVWLYNLTPENIRNRAKLWYNGANRIAKDWSKIYHYNVRQMAGVLAVLSPQKDWFMNTTLGERVVHVYTQHQNTAWSPDMTAWAESYVKASRDIETRDKRQVVLDAAKRLQGTKLKDMSLEDMAYFVRIYDETYHSRKYRVITPEGMFGDYVTVNEEVGEDEDEAGGQGDVAWGTYDSIQKAISILQDGSHENISEQLGDEHKVRNFYNNIVDPDSASGSVTIDTHAVAAAAFKALSGASLEVLHNFGTTPKGLVSAGGSAMTGASGTYGFIADAYREAAAMVGVLPREMQSITWEAIRSIFPAAWKSQNAGQVNAIYDRFKAGEITLKQARDEVLKISGGIKKFAWENDKSGVFPSAGATSFDTAKQKPRVLEPYQIREKLKINLSAAPSTDENAEVIPGIQYLFGKARNNDMAAYTLLQEVASDNARHLLSGIENVKITTVPASGLFFEQFEPSVNLTVAFDYGDKPAVLPALKRFASNFKQKQIHVRQVSKLDVETEYDDGSYNTPVFTFKLEDSFSRDEIQQIVRASGLPGITFTDNQVVAYFMRGKKSETAEEFYGQIEKLAEQLGGFASTIDATVERLWVYGSGYGATQGYTAIKGDVRPGTGVTVETAKRVAAYLNNVRDNKIKTFENADITDEQANKQNAIGDMYDKLPVYDMDRPIVRKAYEALADALLEQYRALPITVSWSKKKNKKGQPVDAYGSDSAAMRKDILDNNRLQILPTTPDSFGPEGYDFSGHPLLEETGLTLDGQPLLYNDLLRAVHDYYAHGMTEVGFGPKGEEAAWKNHMSITKDPLARWALTMETRAQNSYVNFRSGLDRNKVPLKKRGFAEQKAALLPVQVALTGNASVDAPMKEFIKTLSKDERLGSAGDIKLAPGQKFSLRAREVPKSSATAFFKASENIPRSEGIEAAEQVWSGGVADFGDKQAALLIARMPGYSEYAGEIEQLAWEHLAGGLYNEDKTVNKEAVEREGRFYVYRYGDLDLVDEINQGEYEGKFEPKATTLSLNFAKAFKNFAGFDEEDKANKGWMRIAVKPESIIMLGSKSSEMELVVNLETVDTGDAQVIDESFEPVSPQAKFSLRIPETKGFKQWVGKNPIIPASDTSKYKGGSAVFQAFHGTTYSNITVFDPERGSQLGALGAGPYFSTSAKDASANYAGIGPDLKLRIELLADQLEEDFIYYFDENRERLQEYFDDNNIKVDANDLDPKAPKFEDNSPNKYFKDASKYLATKQLKGDSEGLVMPVFIKLEKPFDMTSKNIEFMYDPDAEGSEVDDWSRLIEGVNDLADQMQVVADKAISAIQDNADGMTARELRDIIRDNIALYDDPYTGEPSSPNQFLQYLLKELGYDGIIQNASDEYSTMIGVERSRDPNANRTFHIMPFTPQQVKSATGNKGTFDPTNKDIRYSLRTFFPTAEAAEKAAYKKAPPTTPEFKRFFGASKVKEEGRPQVMYHGSLNEFDQFNEDNRKGLIFVTPNPAFAEEYALLHASRMEKQEEPPVKVYPLWVRAETPFDYENPVHVNKVMNSLSNVMGMNEYIQTEKEVKEGNWAKIEDPRFVAALKKLGFDSLYVKENKTKNLAVFNANQVKSVTGNIGEFGENKSIKYSLPVIPADIDTRVNETTQQREHKGFIERILDVFKPESLADLRASFIHRYNQLGVYDRLLAEKMGGKVLLADMSAEAAANMSDLSASVTYAAFGIGNRRGGIPVYKNGMTIIDNSVRGPLEILSPLAKFNDPKAYQHYQFWAGVKRGSRFMAETSPTGVVSYREKNFEPADIEKAERLRKEYMANGVDFTTIQKEMNTFNDGLVDYMKATGVLAPERAAEFKKHMDYIPFYRQLNGEDTVGPKIFNSISGVKPPKKLKGSEAPLTDYLESIVQNTQAAINAGMKNMAAQRAINVAMQLGPRAGAQRLNTVSSAPDTVQVLENGKQVSYRVADQLFINAVKSLNMAEIPFMGIFSAPSNLLRNLVTKDPGFMLANLARDSLSAWVTSGSNMTPIAGTVSNFVKALSGKDATLHALFNAGILGGYEFSSGVIKSGEVLEKDLNKKYGSAGAAAPLKVFSGIWDALEKGTEASDAATRMAVYERVLAETGNETEALYRALEVMNFNRKGSSPVVRILTAAIPFLNARIQGLDVFYRTAMGTNVTANAEAMQKAFFVRGATLMALSAAYFLAVSDDDEWKKQEQETKDNYWIAPGIGKFPTPFEVGFLFKTVPERIMAYTLKDDTGQDLMDSMRRGLLNTFAFNPIPQIAKPVIEYNVNYNFFTGRPIVGQGMEGLEPQYQVGPNTTKTAEALGKALGMPPIKLDQLISSYTGTMGMYAMTAIDAVLDTQSNSPHASKRFEQLPIIKRFASDPEARGNITQYYELKKSVDAAVQTENLLLKSGKPEEFAEFMEKNAGLLAVKPYVANVEKSMKQMREMRKMVQGAEMSGDEKRDTLIAIGQAENNLNSNIQTIKKMISEIQ